MFRLTPVVQNLIIINVIIFIAQMFMPVQEFTCYADGRGMTTVKDIVTGTLSLWNIHLSCWKPYQLFTYMFVHGSIGHIFFNMLSLAFIAPILETYWGPKRFLLFYIITGIGAAVFSVAVDLIMGGGAGTMLGASGAIYGVLMAFGMMFPNMEIMLLIPPIPIKAKYLVFLLGGITFLLDRSGTVAHFAHFGGAVVGFIIVKVWRAQGGGRDF